MTKLGLIALALNKSRRLQPVNNRRDRRLGQMNLPRDLRRLVPARPRQSLQHQQLRRRQPGCFGKAFGVQVYGPRYLAQGNKQIVMVRHTG